MGYGDEIMATYYAKIEKQKIGRASCRERV